MGHFNPERMDLGVLRVLDYDTVAQGIGFGTHALQNIEILQIWILPNQQNVTPRYDQMSMNFSKYSFHQISSLDKEDLGFGFIKRLDFI